MSKSGAMTRLLVAGLLTAAAFCFTAPAQAQDATSPAILSPADGQYLQGQVQVKGTTQVSGFASSEIDFGYASDPTRTWFLLQTASLPATNDVLAVWDTTLISDGDYVLRLQVSLADGSTRESTVGIHIRNYTLLPTPSPAVTPTQPPVLQVPTAILIVATDTATATAPPPVFTPSALPPNPVSVTPAIVYSQFWRGALLVGVLVVVFGLLIRLRR